MRGQNVQSKPLIEIMLGNGLFKKKRENKTQSLLRFSME